MSAQRSVMIQQEYFFDEKLILGVDLLYSLIGKIIQLREQKADQWAPMEALFLQTAVPGNDSRRFLRLQRQADPVQKLDV